MSREEFMVIVAALKSNYPNWNLNIKDSITLNFWYENLKHIPFDIMQIGIRKLISTEEFYPNIAKILKACASVTTAPVTDSTEAWGLVQRAIRNFGYMRSDEALESLPPDVAKAVIHMGGFQALCESENPEADRAHFYKTMECIERRVKNDSVLSANLIAAIERYQSLAIEQSKEQQKKMLLEEQEKQVKQIEYSKEENRHDSMTTYEEEIEKLRKKIRGE